MSLLRRGSARAVIATALTGWCIAVIPMIRSVYDLRDSGDRSTQMFAVIFVGLVAVPISLIIAAGFLPAHLVLRRRSLAGVWGYLAWGMILLAVASFYVRFANPDAVVGMQDYPLIALAVVGVGAVLGLVFWLTGVLLP